MPAKVEFSPSAVEDLQQATAAYAHESAELAIAFAEEVDAVIRLVARFPRLGAPLKRGLRKLVLSRFPFIVLYRCERERVRVDAVAHMRRAR